MSSSQFIEEPHARQVSSASGVWQQGLVVLGQYKVGEMLGEGGMGMVQRVYHQRWHVDLAVKSPRPDLFVTPGDKADFAAEAETWVKLHLHPHIVACYYVRTIDEIPRIFMEYVDGGSLADWITSRRLYQGSSQEALARILDIAMQAAWGLHAAHEQGLVHQDVKPANVLLTSQGIAKITDFGMAKARVLAETRPARPEDGQQSTLVTARGLTLLYCSPEQAAGHRLSRRTDIWSWAVMLLELFLGDTFWPIGVQAPAALASYTTTFSREAGLPPLPAQLAALLTHCFQREPAQRPASMAEIARELREIYEREVGSRYPREEPTLAESLTDTLNNQAVSLADLERVDEAMALWQQVRQIDPHHPEATYNQEVLHWQRGAITDAELISRLEHAVSARPESLHAAYGLALAQTARGALDQARPLLETIIQRFPSERDAQHLRETIAAGAAPDLHLLAESSELRAPMLSRYHEQDLCTNADGSIALLALSAAPKDPVKLPRRWRFSHAILVLDTRTGRCLRILRGHTQQIDRVCLSADGRVALSRSRYEQSVRLWDIATGRCLRVWNITYVRHVSLSADGSTVALSDHHDVITVWDVTSGRCLHHVEGYHLQGIQLNADGTRLVVCGSLTPTHSSEKETDRALQLVSFKVPGEDYTAGPLRGLSLSAESQLVVFINSRRTDETPPTLDRIKVYDVTTGVCLSTFPPPDYQIPSFSLASPSPRLRSPGMVASPSPGTGPVNSNSGILRLGIGIASLRRNTQEQSPRSFSALMDMWHSPGARIAPSASGNWPQDAALGCWKDISTGSSASGWMWTTSECSHTTRMVPRWRGCSIGTRSCSHVPFSHLLFAAVCF